jgi:hypothetical protein
MNSRELTVRIFERECQILKVELEILEAAINHLASYVDIENAEKVLDEKKQIYMLYRSKKTLPDISDIEILYKDKETLLKFLLDLFDKTEKFSGFPIWISKLQKLQEILNDLNRKTPAEYSNDYFAKNPLLHIQILSNLQKENKQQKLIKLKHYLGDVLNPIFRLFRTNFLYKTWGRELEKSKPTDSIAIEKLLSTTKKLTFQQNLNQPNIIDDFYKVIIKEIESGKIPDNIFLRLQAEKTITCNKIIEYENQLQSKETIFSYLLATMIVGITTQPMYQFGYFAHQWGTHILDQFPKISGNPLDECFAEKFRHGEGITFLILSFLFTNWWGYFYYFINSINQFLFSHLNWWIKIGHYFDVASQYVTIPILEKLEKILPNKARDILERLKDFSRFDEIGLLEKDDLLKWFTGLGINLICANFNYLMPNTVGYLFATLGARSTSKFVELIGKTLSLDNKTSQGFGILAHTVSYPYLYKWGFNTGHLLLSPSVLPEAYEKMSPAEASEIFGSNEELLTTTEIERRFRDKALLVHPDKNPTPEAKIAMYKLTEAREVLLEYVKENQKSSCCIL